MQTLGRRPKRPVAGGHIHALPHQVPWSAPAAAATWCAFTLCTHALPYDHPRRHSNKDDLLSLTLCTSVDSCSPVVGLPGAYRGWSIASWPFGYDQSVVSVLICLTSDRPQWGQRCYQIFEDTVVLLGLLSTYHGLARYCTYLRDRPTPTPFVGRGIISLAQPRSCSVGPILRSVTFASDHIGARHTLTLGCHHTTLNTREPVRSRKLSNVGRG